MSSMIRYALHLRYTSLQADRLLLEKSPMLSLSLLNNVQQGGDDVLKAFKNTLWKGYFSRDCILMIDEMYLQKSAQYQSGEYVEEGNLYKGIVGFMVVGLKLSIPFVVQFVVHGQWLAKKINDNADNLIEIGLCVQGIVTDNIC